MNTICAMPSWISRAMRLRSPSAASSPMRALSRRLRTPIDIWPPTASSSRTSWRIATGRSRVPAISQPSTASDDCSGTPRPSRNRRARHRAAAAASKRRRSARPRRRSPPRAARAPARRTSAPYACVSPAPSSVVRHEQQQAVEARRFERRLRDVRAARPPARGRVRGRRGRCETAARCRSAHRRRPGARHRGRAARCPGSSARARRAAA